MRDNYKEIISKPEISFWVPILITVISWGVSFGILSTKVETVIKNQEQQYSMWLQLEKRAGTLEISLAKNDQFHEEIKNLLKLR